jgi:hypothetical protein
MGLGVWQTMRVGFQHTVLSRLRPLAGPLSFSGSALGLDAGERALRAAGLPLWSPDQLRIFTQTSQAKYAGAVGDPRTLVKKSIPKLI